MNNVVNAVVRRNLCSSCGACAGLCPFHALSMHLQQSGDLAPTLIGTCSERCHLCLDICPFPKGHHNPRDRNVELFGDFPTAKYNEHIGWYLRSVVGFRKDEQLRRTRASGGLATWCLETLLKRGDVTRVACVQISENHDKGFFRFYAASSVDELRRSAPSAYHPVEISEIIKEITFNTGERWAIVGVPCLCAAIRNSNRLRKVAPFVLGLACGMYQNTFYTEMLLEKSGVDRANILNIEYRRKSDSGPPSDYRFRGTDNRGCGKEIPYHGLPYYLGSNAYFRLNACNFCMDVFAEAADACFMDAWLPPYRQNPKGTSLVVIRKKQLSDLLQKGQSEKEIEIADLSPEGVVASQKGHVRRKRELIFMRLHKQGPVGQDAGPTVAERVTWLLQRYAQKRSKEAWARYGRKYGLLGFWIAIADVLLMQGIAGNLTRAPMLPKRLVRKYGRILYGLWRLKQESERTSR